METRFFWHWQEGWVVGLWVFCVCCCIGTSTTIFLSFWSPDLLLLVLLLVCSLETQLEADKDFLVKLFQEKILELLSLFFFLCVCVCFGQQFRCVGLSEHTAFGNIFALEIQIIYFQFSGVDRYQTSLPKPSIFPNSWNLLDVFNNLQ
jgi:hypothetical protein